MKPWEMDAITSVPRLLAAVSEFLPAARTVSFEIQNACSDARKVYAKHHPLEKLRPSRDTISPKTEPHYCIVSKLLSEDLDSVLVVSVVRAYAYQHSVNDYENAPNCARGLAQRLHPFVRNKFLQFWDGIQRVRH